jgi:hypothetical protein
MKKAQTAAALVAAWIAASRLPSWRISAGEGEAGVRLDRSQRLSLTPSGHNRTGFAERHLWRGFAPAHTINASRLQRHHGFLIRLKRRQPHLALGYQFGASRR